MELGLVRAALVLLVTAVAAYTDHKTGYIYDWITYPAMVAGAVLCVLDGQWEGFAMAAGVFAIGYPAYYAGKLGGGDIKLFAGLALLFPFAPGLGVPFVLVVALYAALLAVVVLGAYFVARYAIQGIEWEEEKEKAVRALALGIVLFAYFALVTAWGAISIWMALAMGAVFSVGLAFMALERGIRKHFFVKEVRVRELEEDEPLALEFLPEKTLKALGRMRGKGIADEKVKRALLKSRIAHVVVYRDLPRFAPFIFLGVLVAVGWPDLALSVLGWAA